MASLPRDVVVRAIQTVRGRVRHLAGRAGSVVAGGRPTWLVCRFTRTGRHDGPFLGVPPTGVEIALPGITALRFRDGRCVERWSAADMLGVLVQVGAVPAPV
ncbi:ester cyclase [Pseudonocardia dioxanivorans]|uniref:ester cyclase n=1 Tax=Pseudonocardia dioxanivorans TaxID=240495 RepID=UPI001F1F7966|nr:ester cyclase [Pseudonocardia dioxanivorans]